MVKKGKKKSFLKEPVKSKRIFKKSKRATVELPRAPGILEKSNVL